MTKKDEKAAQELMVGFFNDAHREYLDNLASGELGRAHICFGRMLGFQMAVYCLKWESVAEQFRVVVDAVCEVM